jgi:molecular chaperone DnaJ
MKMRGKGNEIFGGIPGDLIVVAQVRPHKLFKKMNMDLIYDMDISFVDLILGKNITVPHFEGDIKIDTPANHNFQNALMINHKGFKGPGGETGDLYIHFNPKNPIVVNQEEKKLLQELANSENFN